VIDDSIRFDPIREDSIRFDDDSFFDPIKMEGGRRNESWKEAKHALLRACLAKVPVGHLPLG
jgi:hypothetical protein